jgi:hypothetical protein
LRPVFPLYQTLTVIDFGWKFKTPAELGSRFLLAALVTLVCVASGGVVNLTSDFLPVNSRQMAKSTSLATNMLNNYTQYLQHNLPLKSIKQKFTPNTDQIKMMNTFKDMVNHCIRIGLDNNCSSMKKLSLLSYHTLKDYQIQSKYKPLPYHKRLVDWHKEKKTLKKAERQNHHLSKNRILFHVMDSKSTACCYLFPYQTESLPIFC